MRKKTISKETLAAKAVKIARELEEFTGNNSFKSGDLDLKLIYNPWHATSGGAQYTYTLTHKNSSLFNIKLDELAKLKDFLNSINLIE